MQGVISKDLTFYAKIGCRKPNMDIFGSLKTMFTAYLFQMCGEKVIKIK